MTSPDTDQQVLTSHHRLALALDNRWSFIEITGPDAAQYLHNRCTQDVLGLAEGEGCWLALLNKSAHIQAYGSLHRMGETYWLLLPKVSLPQALAELEKYRIIENVRFCANEQVNACWIIGPESSAYLQQTIGINLDDLPPLGAVRLPFGEWAGSRLIHLSPGVMPGALWLLTDSQQPAHTLDPPFLSPAALDVIRVEAGYPLWGQDYDTSSLLPETGLETQSVSDTKGCYLGQETVARVKTYGAVKKRLTGLQASLEAIDLLTPDMPVTLENGLTVGRLTSVAASSVCQATLALAYLSKGYRTPGQSLALQTAAGIRTVTVVQPPFIQFQSAKEQAKTLLREALEAFARLEAEASLDAIIDQLQEARRLAPDCADVIESLGALQARQGHYEQAIALMDQLLILDPDRVMAHTNKSIYWLKLGNKEKAETEKARATVLSMRLAARRQAQVPHQMTMSGPSANLVDQAAHARRQQTRERVQLFLHALAQSPDDPLGNFGLGCAYLELGEAGQAIPYFEKAVEMQPNHSVAYGSLGRCYQQTGQWEKARATWQQGIIIAATRGDHMPLQEMRTLLDQLPLEDDKTR